MPDEPAEPDAPNEDPPEPQKPDTGDEVEKWKSLARKHEQRAKDNNDAARRLKELEDADKSESQKKDDRIAELERQTAESDRRAGERVAKAEVTAALASVITDRKTLRDIVDDLNLSNYIGEDGDIDDKRVEKLVKRYEDMVPTGPPSGSRMPSGARGQGSGGSIDMNAAIRQAAGRG